MIPIAGRVAIPGVVLTLALGLLTACDPTPARSGGLVGRMTATSDVANLPGGLTGAEPVADPHAWAGLVVPLMKADVSELGGTVTSIDENGDFRITAPPGRYTICYWDYKIGGLLTGCAELELPREGELAALTGEGGFGITVKE